MCGGPVTEDRFQGGYHGSTILSQMGISKTIYQFLRIKTNW